MINQRESKNVRMGSWLLKLLPRDMKTNTQNNDQTRNNYKNNRKINAMGNIISTMDHYPRNG